MSLNPFLRSSLLLMAVALTIPTVSTAQPGSWYQNIGLPTYLSHSLSVWASAPDDVWLAGGFQNLQHWDGNSWSLPAQPGTANRYTVFGLSTGEVFTSGQNIYQSGAIHSCTVTACTTIYTAETELVGLWGRSPTDLFTSGDGIIRHFDGTSWTNIPTGLSSEFNLFRLEAIGGGATKTFFVGRFGKILQYDGFSLHEMASGTSTTINGVAALSDDLAYFVGQQGTILKWDGTSFTPMHSGTTENIIGIFALSPTSIYASGTNGTVLHFDGNEWSPVDIGIGGTLGVPFALSESQIYIPRSNDFTGEVITSENSMDGRVLITPEPSTGLLLAAGIVVLCGMKRRSNTSYYNRNRSLPPDSRGDSLI